MLVHFPVAAWTVATSLALLAPWQDPGNSAALVIVLARYSNGFGLATGVAAILAGLVELTTLPADGRLRAAAARHLVLAVCAWFAYGFTWALQVKHMLSAAAATGLIAFGLLVLAGHAGARVVYHHGFPGRTETR